jgi:uncharacterized protein (TIGR03067 family)
MKRHCFLLLGVALLVGTAHADDKDKKSDLDKLKGAWKATSGETGGQPLPNDFLDSVTFTIKGDKYTFKVADMEDEEGTLKLDSTKKPAQMDVSITKGNDKGKKQFAIYQIEGDTLKLCFSAPEQERPKDFTTKEGTMSVLMVFKRQK